MRLKEFSIIIITSLVFCTCDKLLLKDVPANNSVECFDELWNEFNEKYGLFEIKGIDWDSVYQVCRPLLNENSSKEELYDVLVDMLAVLNDSHVALLPLSDEFPFFQSGILGKIDTINDFELDIIKKNYLMKAHFAEPFFTYGLLTNEIGYVHIEGFSDTPKYLEEPIDEILSELENTKSIIIDVRGGYGGEDIAGQYIAGRFANDTKLYMKSRVKSGAGKNDFTPFQEWILSPTGSFQYTKPVIVLTHRFTISARETFCLAMKMLPSVTFVGDTTAGAFSNQINRELPNGWGYSLSIGQWLDANGKSHEGIGLPPDIAVINNKQDILNGIDEVLEEAITLLASQNR